MITVTEFNPGKRVEDCRSIPRIVRPELIGLGGPLDDDSVLYALITAVDIPGFYLHISGLPIVEACGCMTPTVLAP